MNHYTKILSISLLSMMLWTVFCTAQDTDNILVWPGDINNNGIVNHVDLLYLGVAYTEEGNPRNQQLNNWGGFLLPTIPWSTDYLNGLNYSYADCNGDGEVNIFDYLVVEDNYGLVHGEIEEDAAPDASALLDPQISFGIDNIFIGQGQEVSLILRLGTDDNPVDAFHGLAFTLEYNMDYIEEGSVSFEFLDNWIEPEEGLPVLSIQKDNATENTIEIAVTKTNGVSESGSGAVGILSFIIIDDVPDVIDDDIIIIDEVLMVDEFLQVSPVLGDVLSATILTQNEDYITQLEEINIYPNPILNNQFQINLLVSLELENVILYDISGKEQSIIVRNDSGKVDIQTENLPIGIYILEIRTDKGSYHKKVFVSEQ
jgi:hypothetical protein